MGHLLGIYISHRVRVGLCVNVCAFFVQFASPLVTEKSLVDILSKFEAASLVILTYRCFVAVFSGEQRGRASFLVPRLTLGLGLGPMT